ncbi:MAG: DUF4350 domain-containing protein, partial [Bacteroidota bacterium]
ALVVLASPTPMDTRIRLEREGSAPFDAEVFYESLAAWVGTEVTPVDRPAYEVLDDSTLTGTTYLFLTREFAPGEAEADRLGAFLRRGNTVVAIAHSITGPFVAPLGSPDSASAPLGTDWEFDWSSDFGVDLTGADPDTLRLVGPGVAGSFAFPLEVTRTGLGGFDPATSEILGLSGDGEIVTLARVEVGDGTLILCTTPLAFTNAALVGEGDAEAYVSGVLASVPRQPILWDDYRKPYSEQVQTPFRYVLQSPGLAGAYWLLLSLFVLYVLFRGRRWQRAIPVVTPPPNAQKDFAETVGRLHFTHGDTARLADRTVRVFMDRLRTRLRLVSPDLSEGTARLAAKTAGVPEEEGLALFARLRRLKKSSRPTAADLIDLDARLDRFFRHLDAAPARDDSRDDAPDPAPEPIASDS